MTAFNTVFFAFILTSIQGQDKKCRQTPLKEFLVVLIFSRQNAENNAEQNEAADLNTANCIKGEKQHCDYIFSLFDCVIYILIYTTDVAGLQSGRVVVRK